MSKRLTSAFRRTAPTSPITTATSQGSLSVRIGVLGTGVVGQTLSAALSGLGHDVVVGSRQAPPATFADAAQHGEVVLNCTSGVHSLEALHSAGAEALTDKVLIDVANPLDFSGGFPPRLSVSGDDSLAEQIQRAFPRTR